MAPKQTYKRKAYTVKKKLGKKRFGAKWLIPKIDLELGKNVPFAGGSRLKINNVRNIVRREMDRQEEIKQFVDSKTDIVFANNSINCIFPYLNMKYRGVIVTPQCYMRTFMLNLNLITAQPLMICRILGVWTPKTTDGVVGTTSPPGFSTTGYFSFSDLFLTPTNGSASPTYATDALINNKSVHKIVFDKKYTLKENIPSSIIARNIKVALNVNKKVTWKPDGSALTPDNFVWVVITSSPTYTVVNTSAVTNNSSYESLVTYKDD